MIFPTLDHNAKSHEVMPMGQWLNSVVTSEHKAAALQRKEVIITNV